MSLLMLKIFHSFAALTGREISHRSPRGHVISSIYPRTGAAKLEIIYVKSLPQRLCLSLTHLKMHTRAES